MTLTLTLDLTTRRTDVHHSSTSTYIPNFIQIEETFCGRMDIRTFETDIIRSTIGSRPKNWVISRGHAHFRDGLSTVGWDLLCSTHVLNLKCLRLPATKKWKATPNVKILVLSHPLGDLGVTHRVHLWFDGKCVVDFPIAIIAILASSHGCSTIKRNLSKSAFSDRGGSL